MTPESASQPAIRFQRLPLLTGDVFPPNIDLTEYVVSHSSSCYFIRVKGESMESMNIHDGDLLVVDRSLSAKANDLVIVVEDDTFRLMQATAYNAQQYSFDYDLFIPLNHQTTQLWGVVTHVIHHCR